MHSLAYYNYSKYIQLLSTRVTRDWGLDARYFLPTLNYLDTPPTHGRYYYYGRDLRSEKLRRVRYGTRLGQRGFDDRATYSVIQIESEKRDKELAYWGRKGIYIYIYKGTVIKGEEKGGGLNGGNF